MSDNVDVAEVLAALKIEDVIIPRKIEKVENPDVKVLEAVAFTAPKLTREQERAVNYVLEGRNMFLTGRAGTGKSFTLKHIIGMLPTRTTFVAATTGCAAVNVGGTTYHKFSGIGLGNGPVSYILERLSKQGRMNWQACRVLVIDEISMMKGQMFDKLDEIARRVRGVDLPFGGIQLLLCGDFFQCPPVNKKFSDDDEDAQQCFEARCWDKCIDIQFELTEVVRQKEELGVGLVNALRESATDKNGVVQLDQKWIELMDYLARPLKKRKDGILPTKLFCTNRDVDRENLAELDRLEGEEHIFLATDQGKDPWRKDMETHCIAPSELKLKVGAQVMLIKNHLSNPKLVNGSRGVIVRFEMDKFDPCCKAPLPVVKFKNGEEEMIRHETWEIQDQAARTLASRTQVALKLAWCMTVHKSQGMTIDYLEIHIADAFDYGIAYVALTRFTSLTGLRIVNYNLQKIRNNPRVVLFNKRMRQRPENQAAAAA
jgi:ATP-dependent DNA helicase PIF1